MVDDFKVKVEHLNGTESIIAEGNGHPDGILNTITSLLLLDKDYDDIKSITAVYLLDGKRVDITEETAEVMAKLWRDRLEEEKRSPSAVIAALGEFVEVSPWFSGTQAARDLMSRAGQLAAGAKMNPRWRIYAVDDDGDMWLAWIGDHKPTNGDLLFMAERTANSFPRSVEPLRFTMSTSRDNPGEDITETMTSALLFREASLHATMRLIASDSQKWFKDMADYYSWLKNTKTWEATVAHWNRKEQKDAETSTDA